jgi:hypothetical protein
MAYQIVKLQFTANAAVERKKKLLLRGWKAPGSNLVSVSIYSPIPTYVREGKSRKSP